MGWTTMHREAGQTDREFWQGQLGPQLQIADCATVRGTFYAAVQGPGKDAVWAFVALTHRAPNSYYNFGYKDMSETMGPNEDSCPARVLDLLTPLAVCGPHAESTASFGYCGTCSARNWRERCRANADNRARAAKVKPGQVIRFALPIRFQSGQSLDTLTFVKRDTFTVDGYPYRISNWRVLSGWKVIAP